MIDWIETHQAVLNVCIGIATLLVWVIYAQLLYSGFRRARTSKVIINMGKKSDLNALCIISNMSQEGIYVEYILATLETSRGDITMDVTDFERDPKEEREDDEGNTHTVSVTPRSIRENTRQGPLLSGEFMHIGTFNEIVSRLTRHAGITMQGYRPEGDVRLECLTLQLIALYGPESRPISATRGFDIDSHEDGGRLTPTSWQTHQGISYLHRRRLSKMVDDMNDNNFSVSSTINWEKD